MAWKLSFNIAHVKRESNQKEKILLEEKISNSHKKK